MSETIHVIGGGLAGSEAAWQAAERGFQVRLYEMRPGRRTPAHETGGFAELVCSNSLRAEGLQNAVGLLKEELRLGRSLIMEAADRTRVPAGGALAVDRDLFSKHITARLENHPLVEIMREEVSSLGEEMMILATGPLTSEAMASELHALTGSEHLYFYDAIAPIVEAESIHWERTFSASRYGKGGDDYVNCPLTQAEYERFLQELLAAEKMPAHAFEKERVFEGCMPIETLAERGADTLRFGPMKPVGLVIPETGEQPYAVVQLRMENRHGTAYNMVGFQTKLKWPEQTRVFRLIPGLEDAAFLRYGSLHRNTYLCTPAVADPFLRLIAKPNVILAGQISGVEGYVESTAMGWLAGVNAARLISGKPPVVPPAETAHGGLADHVTRSSPSSFQPSNINFGLLPALRSKIRNRRLRYEAISARALEAWRTFLAGLETDDRGPA